jgi:beta-glucosidase-like glycosyl hydrolase
MTDKKPRNTIMLNDADFSTLVKPYQVDGETKAQTVRRILQQHANGLLESAGVSDTPNEIFKHAKVETRLAMAEKLALSAEANRLYASPKKMLELAAQHTAQNPSDILTESLLIHCQSLLTNALTEREQRILNSNGSPQGIKGAADDRISEYHDKYLRDYGKKPNASRIAKHCQTNYHTAKNWLDRHK